MSELSPWAKAARTRKRRKRARERAARDRSIRARHAALVRWYGSSYSNKKKPKTPKKPEWKTPKKKVVTAKKGKKKKPGPKPKSKKEALAQEEIQRLKRKIREKDKKVAIMEKERKLFKEHIRPKGTIESMKRFGAEFKLPPKMKHETDIQFAKRVIKQMMGKNMYTVEAAIEHYKTISEATGISETKAFSLFMSPQAA